jgi:redox-sensitive bicupin YhaK (pirin superfamily)
MISSDQTIKAPLFYVRRAQERGQTRLDWLQSWHTFSFGDYFDPQHHHWGALRVINDDIVKPSSGFGTHPHNDMEIVTWVISGTLKHQDSLGNGTLIPAGDIQRMSAGTGIQHSEWNPSDTEPVHLLQIWIRPLAKNITPSYEQKTVAYPTELKDWVEVASPSGSEHAVQVNQQAWIYASGLIQQDSERSLTTQLNQRGWLHVIRGTVMFESLEGKQETLSAGDALGVQGGVSSSVTLAPQTEALWFVVPEV